MPEKGHLEGGERAKWGGQVYFLLLDLISPLVAHCGAFCDRASVFDRRIWYGLVELHHDVIE
jgi:hypothetical protein